MTFSSSFALALKTLRRNGLRSCLTLLGITIGVGAVLTMVAVGNGARASIEDQVTAAGMNVITVTAGNYRMKGEDPGGGVVDHQAFLAPDGDGWLVGQVGQVGRVGLVSLGKPGRAGEH